MASEILATNVVIKIEGKVYGCAQSASFSTKFSSIAVPCARNGAFAKTVPGIESWDGSLTAIVTTFTAGAETTANVSLRDIYTKLREKALVDIEYELGGLDGFVFSSKAYLTNVDISVPEGDGVVTYSTGLVGAEPLLLAA